MLYHGTNVATEATLNRAENAVKPNPNVIGVWLERSDAVLSVVVWGDCVEM